MKRFILLLAGLMAAPAFADCIFREDTASQTFLIGPFLNEVDGITAETGLTIANTDIRLSKNGGNMAAKNSGGGTHDEEGLYQITLDATDTDTAGTLQISLNDVANHVPVWHECMVYATGFYDLLDGTTTVMTSRQAGNVLETTITTATTQLELDLAAGDSNNDSYNNMCAVFQAGTEGCSARVDDYTGTGAILFLDATANTCGGVTLATPDTVRIQDGVCGVALEIAQLDLDVITGAGGAVLDTNAVDSGALDASAVTEIWDNFYPFVGTADSGSTTTLVDALLTEADTDYWANGNAVVITSGTSIGQARCISAFTPGSDQLTWKTALTQAITTNTYAIMPLPSCGDITLPVDAITAAVMATGAIASDAFVAGAINAAAINTGAIGSDQIAANAIGASEIAANAIGFSEIAADAIGASELAADAATEIADAGHHVLAIGICDSGSTTTCVDATLTEADDYWKGASIKITDGTLDGQTSCVYDFTASSDTLLFRAMTAAVSTHTYVLLENAVCEGVVSP